MTTAPTKRQVEMLKRVAELAGDDPEGWIGGGWGELYSHWGAGPSPYSEGPARTLEFHNFSRIGDALVNRGLLKVNDDGIFLTEAGDRLLGIERKPLTYGAVGCGMPGDSK